MRVASPWFGRIDLAAELYDREIFNAATFARLEQNGRPLVIINATNLGPGRGFNFTQEYFDAMGSDLEPISGIPGGGGFLGLSVSIEPHKPEKLPGGRGLRTALVV